MDILPLFILFLIPFLGGIWALNKQLDNSQGVKLFLSFSGAFLLSVCVLHLLPELFADRSLHVAPFILLGFFLQIVFEYASQGVEHGHIHRSETKGTFPALIYFGLCLHAFTEGLPLSGIVDQGIYKSPLFWGIMLHKIPVVIVLISLFMAHGLNRKTMFAGLFFFTTLAPLGGFTGKLFSGASWNLLPYFLAVSTGIFLHISTVILFETSYNHRFNFIKFVYILAGGALAILLF